jgi:hypothetical protein
VKVRDKLRDKGIRVSNDLTYMQREQLKALNRQGKSGYYKNGDLYIRSDNKQTENVPGNQRTVRQARHRQNDSGDNMETAAPVPDLG